MRKRIKKRRLRRKLYFQFAFLFVFLSFFALLPYFVHMPALSVYRVDVQGKDKLLNGKLREFAYEYLSEESFLPRYNILFFGKDSFNERVVIHFPELKKLEISFSSKKRALALNYKQRETLFLWCDKAHDFARNCYRLSDDGVVFKKAANLTSDVPTVAAKLKERPGVSLKSRYPLNFKISEKDMALLVFLQENLSGRKFLPTVMRYELSGEEVKVYFENFFLKLRRAEERKMRETLDDFFFVFLKELKDKRESLEYVDMRFGNKIYYKMKNEKEE